ncbi:MAG: hypothetical protein K2M65_05430, partial [Muribaculaceae bacterium]|nr:hypothetical protein [Muribaculaceae bacterium]
GMGQEPAASAKMTIPANVPAAKSMSAIQDMQVTKNARLLNASQLQTTTKPAVSTVIRKAAQRAETTTDYSGTWIITYNTLLQEGDDGGEAVTLEATATENVYLMKNLWVNGTTVNIQIDPTTGAVTIANQIIGTLNDGTKLDITAINQGSGAAERMTPITGQVNADGTITIDTWWAVYNSTETEMSTGMYVAFYNTRMLRPNGQMTFTDSEGVSTVPVYANQTADNVLEITNMLNGGLTIEMVLNRDLTATIALQPILCNSGTTYQIVNATIDSDNKVNFTTPVTTQAATNKKEIKLTDWSGYGLTSAGSPAWLGMFTNTTITLDNEVSYPTLNVSSLKGEGTKENPWLISTKDDMIYLSDWINGMETVGSGSLLCTGEYFSLTNDIDMSCHRFTTIANDYYHIFNGTFDGNGHTIKGLTINTTKYA